jgi:autophagy-related protein 2
MELQLRGLHVRIDTFARDEQVALRVKVSIDDIELHDCLVSSPFWKFLCYHQNNVRGRPMNARMLSLELLSVRPDLDSAREEYRLTLGLAPLRLLIDQDAIEFLLEFFVVNPTGSSPLSPSSEHDHAADGAVPTSHTIHVHPTESGDTSGQQTVQVKMEKEEPEHESTTEAVSYIQLCLLGALSITVDYKPKHVDFHGLRRGDFLQLLHLFPFEDFTILLPALRLSGIETWAGVIGAVVAQWGMCAATQVPKVLGSLQPIRSFVKVGAAAKDVFVLPTDTTLFNALGEFVRSLARETAEVGARLAQGAQSVLEDVDDVLAYDRSEATSHAYARRRQRYSPSSEQPANFEEGARQAVESIARSLQVVFRRVVFVPVEEYHRKGAHGAVKSIVHAVPGAVLRPLWGVAEGTSRLLRGVQNSVDPLHKDVVDVKYKKLRGSRSGSSGPARVVPMPVAAPVRPAPAPIREGLRDDAIRDYKRRRDL